MYNSKIRTAPNFHPCLLVNLTPTPFPQLLKYQKHDNYCKCKHFYWSKKFPLSSEFASCKEEIPPAQIIGIKFYFLRNFNFSNKIWTLQLKLKLIRCDTGLFIFDSSNIFYTCKNTSLFFKWGHLTICNESVVSCSVSRLVEFEDQRELTQDYPKRKQNQQF